MFCPVSSLARVESDTRSKSRVGLGRISLDCDRDRTLHEFNTRYIVSGSGIGSLIPGNLVFVSDDASKPTRPARVAILMSCRTTRLCLWVGGECAQANLVVRPDLHLAVGSLSGG